MGSEAAEVFAAPFSPALREVYLATHGPMTVEAARAYAESWRAALREEARGETAESRCLAALLEQHTSDTTELRHDLRRALETITQQAEELQKLRAKKPSEATKADAVQRYQAGEGQREIADALGVSQSAVMQWLRRAGVKARKPGEMKAVRLVPPEVSDEIVRRYLAGESFNQIGKALNLSPLTVRKRCQSAGVKPRTLSDATRLGRGTTPEQAAEAVRRYLQGAPSGEIAASIGVHASTVLGWVRAAGVPVRNRWDSRRLREAAHD